METIDTAPKDGTHILLYGTYQWEDYKSHQKTGWVVGYWYEDFDAEWSDPENYDDCDKFWRLVNANPYIDRCQPTHWKPLPETP